MNASPIRQMLVDLMHDQFDWSDGPWVDALLGSPLADVIQLAQDRLYSDCGMCPYFWKTGDKVCIFGCRDEPECETCHVPDEPWIAETVSPEVRALLQGWERAS